MVHDRAEQLDDLRYGLTAWGHLLFFADQVLGKVIEQNPEATKDEIVLTSANAIYDMAPQLGRFMIREIGGFDYGRMFDNGLRLELSLVSIDD